MSKIEKDGNDLQDDKSLAKDNSTAKKYSFEKMQRDISTDAKSFSETLKDSSIEILTQVAHEKSASIFDNTLNGGEAGSPLGNNNGDISKDDDRQSLLEQNTESLSGNNVKLDLVELADDNNKRREKIRREDLTKGEIEEICRDRDGRKSKYTKRRTPGLDPRFQEQNQTLRCFVMYTDFYRCEKILGQGETACQWFKDVFTTICPVDWVRRWDEAREEGTLPWMKGKTQGKFPGDRYGV